MRFLDRDGVRLAWNESGSGTPILLIMGHRYSSAMWYPLMEALADRYHLIWFDNRGTGQSGSPRRTSVAEMAADALAVLDAAGVQTAHVYGVSMGGGIALEFGRVYPERTRSLILGCTMAKTPDLKPKPRWLMNLVYNLPTPILKALGSSKFKNGYGDAAPDDRIARDMGILAKDPFTRHGVLAQAHAIQDYSITPEQVKAITLPALVLHGTQDLAVPYEAGKALSEMLPNARLVTFPDIGHNYFIGAGEKANAEFEAFVASVEAGRS
ncbi:alpha/beta hydrolase [Brevundimonas kwangchunensis]|uniref:Alpha/beta hydrolase n=1 Tax=Brevundimonas kwangchunensis TaxID=322163 RepID=A0ABN1H309_9CAUL